MDDALRTEGEKENTVVPVGCVLHPVAEGQTLGLLKSDVMSQLLESGTAVNVSADAFVQSPAHLAARGGQAFFLLWQQQTGANLNQQDWLGEAPIHKAAKAGSLECLTFLVASHASIDLRNKDGQTAEELAWALGFLECAQFLKTVKRIQNKKAQQSSTLHYDNLLTEASSLKRACESKRPISKKRMKLSVKDDDPAEN